MTRLMIHNRVHGKDATPTCDALATLNNQKFNGHTL